jgi:hypothetical protein
MGLALAATLAVCVYVLAEEPTPLRWMPAVLPALLFALLYWRYHAVPPAGGGGAWRAGAAVAGVRGWGRGSV